VLSTAPVEEGETFLYIITPRARPGALRSPPGLLRTASGYTEAVINVGNPILFIRSVAKDSKGLCGRPLESFACTLMVGVGFSTCWKYVGLLPNLYIVSASEGVQRTIAKSPARARRRDPLAGKHPKRKKQSSPTATVSTYQVWSCGAPVARRSAQVCSQRKGSPEGSKTPLAGSRGSAPGGVQGLSPCSPQAKPGESRGGVAPSCVPPPVVLQWHGTDRTAVT